MSDGWGKRNRRGGPFLEKNLTQLNKVFGNCISWNFLRLAFGLVSTLVESFFHYILTMRIWHVIKVPGA
jgi:hypothetical protein